MTTGSVPAPFWCLAGREQGVALMKYPRNTRGVNPNPAGLARLDLLSLALALHPEAKRTAGD